MGVSLATPTKVEQLQMTLHATAKRTSLYRGLRGPKRESLSESRMREIRTSGLMSGRWKRSMAGLVRHRQTKEPVTDRPRLNHRATSRLYSYYDAARRNLPELQSPRPGIPKNSSHYSNHR